ncbi:MAG: PAS domain-containing sensor histidine kinase [Marinoscillum sp.]
MGLSKLSTYINAKSFQYDDGTMQLIIRRMNGFCLSVALILAIINFSFHLMYQGWINVATIILVYIPVFFLQIKGRLNEAKLLLATGVLLSITLLTYLNIQNGRNSFSEILIVAIAFFIMLVLTGWPRLVLFCVTWFAISGLLYFKSISFDGAIGPQFYFILLNLFIAYLGIYFFSQIYKNELDKSVRKVKGLNAELTQSRLIMSAMTDNAPLFLAMFDTSGKYIVVNKKYEEAFKMSKDQIEGKHYREVLSDELVKFHEPIIQKVIETGEPSDFYQEVNTTEGVFMHSYGKYFPVYDQHKVMQYITVFVTDITNLKEVEKELIAHNKAKDRMFSVLAHDIISPINLLRNALFLSDHEHISENDLKGHISKVRSNLSNLSHMMENLVKWAHSQFHGFTVQNEPVDINVLISENIGLFDELIKAKALTIECLDEPSNFVVADRGHLNLVLRNLINNAIKFTEDEGTIRFISERTGGNITLSVIDTGIGLDPHLIDLLKHQKQIHSQIGTNGEHGTGLGLSMCWQISELNMWNIRVERSTDGGSVFSLDLPLLVDQAMEKAY